MEPEVPAEERREQNVIDGARLEAYLRKHKITDAEEMLALLRKLSGQRPQFRKRSVK